MVVDSQAAHLAHDVDDGFRFWHGNSRAGGGNPHLGVAVVMAQRDGDQPVHQRVLGLVDAGVFLGIGGEDGAEVGMHFEVATLGAVEPRHRQHPLLQDAQQHVVGLGTGAIELVVNQRVAVPAGGGKPIIHPHRA